MHAALRREMATVSLGGVLVGAGQPTFVCAEAGQNHNGSMDKAKRLIDIAVEAGAQCVKFQKRDVDSLFTQRALDRPYDSVHAFAPTYGAHRRAVEFSEAQFAELKAYADERKIAFTASPWDIKSVDVLMRVGVPFFKVASADLTNWPLLEYILRQGKPVVLSTGMATMEQVREVVARAKRINPQLVVLQCASTYPCDASAVNLRVMDAYRRELGVVAGYSGHEKGIAISVAAAALGAAFIERHITEDRTQKGNDHAASLEPGGLQKMIRDIRQVEQALGDGRKKVEPGEAAVKLKLAKSICSTRAIPAGTTFAEDMLCCKSDVVAGISPLHLYAVIGRNARRDVAADTAIQPDDVVTWTRRDD